MVKYVMRKLTNEDVNEIDAYHVDSKYAKNTFNHAEFVKSFKVKGTSSLGLILRCKCGQHFVPTNGVIAGKSKKIKTEEVNCGCIEEKQRRVAVQNALDLYSDKVAVVDKVNTHYCSYCESYRPKPTKERKGVYCDNCKFLQKEKVVVGKSFNEVIAEWNPDTHNLKYKKLPILKGSNKKGYEIRGFTYIDSVWYEQAVKWCWVKDVKYATTSFSKDNLKRVGKLDCLKKSSSKKYSYMKLHRFVLGLGNGLNLVGDHANGVKLDNRFKNLRIGTTQQNSFNSLKSEKTDGKYKGVNRIYRDKERTIIKEYAVCFRKEGRLKGFKCEETAAKFYDTHLRDNHPSEFNVYNFPLIGERSAITGRVRKG